MNLTKGWISPDVADNYGLFSPCIFSMGQSYSWPAVWFPGCHCHLWWQLSGHQGFAWALGTAGDGDSAASAISPCGFPLLGQCWHWWPLPLHCLEMASGPKALWEAQGPLWAVGHPPPACTWASSSFQAAHSQFFLEGLYPTERVGVEIAHRWELTAGALTRPLFLLPWGNLANLCSFPTFIFFTNVDCEVPLVSCLWPDLSQKLF